MLLLGILLAIAGVYLIRILKDMKVLSEKARDEGEHILEDVKAFREETKYQGGSVLKFLSSWFGAQATSRKGTRTSRKKDTGV